MNNYILIGIESYIDHIGSIRDLGIAYWKKANKKMQVGDIVYLFISDTEHNRISFRLLKQIACEPTRNIGMENMNTTIVVSS